MKKFYKMASTAKAGEGYEIHLDGRPVKTPSKQSLSIPNQVIADAIVLEWAAQKDEIIPDTMPVTQILMTAQDRVSAERTVMSEQIMAYLNTDMLCYRVDSPAELAALQNKIWGGFCEALSERYGYELLVTTGLSALVQPEGLRAKIESDIAAMDDLRFTVLQLMTAASGSLLLALSLVHDPDCADDLLKAAFLDEDYKDDLYDAQTYGADPMTEKKKAAFDLDLRACVSVLKSL